MTSTIDFRTWIQSIPECATIKETMIKDLGRWPCCGEIDSKYKKMFIELLRGSVELQQKLRVLGVTNVSISDNTLMDSFTF